MITNFKYFIYFIIFLLYTFIVFKYSCCYKPEPNTNKLKFVEYVRLKPLKYIDIEGQPVKYTIENDYQYDSIDVEIIPPLLQNRLIDYYVTINNEIFIPLSQVDNASLYFLEIERKNARKKILGIN